MVRPPLEIPESLLQELYLHADEGYPAEVVGFLIGARERSSVDEVHRCVNLQASDKAKGIVEARGAETAYELDTKDTLRLAKSERAERQIKVIYHSHPDVGAYFSETDKRVALMGGDEPAFGWVRYLVVDAQAPAAGGARGAKLFDWDAQSQDFVCVAEYAKLNPR